MTDIALRVVGGILVADDPAAFPRLGDGVNFNVGAEGSFLTANGIYTAIPVPADAPRRAEPAPHGLRRTGALPGRPNPTLLSPLS